MTPAVLHLSPHPDDELIGAPATLMALRDAGWRVVNLACGLGGPEQRDRREAELRQACGRAGFELLLGRTVGEAIDEVEPAIVVSPGPRDRHPRHELVASAARRALEERQGEARWWTWALWGALAQPNLGTAFTAARLEEILAALSAHRGELQRNDYRRLVRARAEANACLAPELLFGFGSRAEPGHVLAELLTELALVEGSWRLGRARWLDPAAPLAEPTGVEAGRLADPAAPG